MKLLKENYKGLKKLYKLPQYFKDFLSRADVQEALKDSDFKSLYSKSYRGASKITELLNTLGIDPLNYLTYIPDNFLFYTQIKSIDIPDHIKEIGDSAFCGCSGLTSITIPDNVTSIGGSAFLKCSSLKNITLPSSITNIDRETFAECSGLTSIVIPGGVTSIGQYAFRGCTHLTNIVIPDTVVHIEEEAFMDCKALTNITIPGSLAAIDASVFYGCTNLKTITYKGTKAAWEKIYTPSNWYHDSSKTIHCIDGDITL